MATKENPANERRILRRRRQLRQLLGAAVSVLVVIGLVAVVTGGVQLTAKLFDNTDEMREYEERLKTLVALDPIPFETLAEADTTTLMNAVIWATLATVNKEIMEHDDLGALYLPTVDIDKTAALLYGPDFKFNHQTFTSRDLEYVYVPEKEAYLLPITSANTDYFPRVEKMQRKGDTKRVTIGYLSVYTGDYAYNPNATPSPVKYNDYIFIKNKNDGKYYLSAITASEMKVDATLSGSLSTAPSMEAILPETLPDESQSTAESSTSVSAQSASATSESESGSNVESGSSSAA